MTGKITYEIDTGSRIHFSLSVANIQCNHLMEAAFERSFPANRARFQGKCRVSFGPFRIKRMFVFSRSSHSLPNVRVMEN